MIICFPSALSLNAQIYQTFSTQYSSLAVWEFNCSISTNKTLSSQRALSACISAFGLFPQSTLPASTTLPFNLLLNHKTINITKNRNSIWLVLYSLSSGCFCQPLGPFSGLPTNSKTLLQMNPGIISSTSSLDNKTIESLRICLNNQTLNKIHLKMLSIQTKTRKTGWFGTFSCWRW